MKKHTTAGPTGLTRIRTLIAFRHQNPVARLVSTLLAFAIAMLLVLGSGAAYADDATPPANPTTTAPDANGPDAAAPDMTVTADLPADTTSPAADEPSAPADSTLTTSDTTTSPSTSPKLSKLATSTKLSPLASTPPTNPTWIWRGSATIHDDFEKDDTAYGGGASEDTAPSTWSQASADTPKADLLKYYFNVDDTSDIIVSFGFTRASTNGDTAFAAELNQHANGSNTPPQPIRTPGDVLLKFHVDSGNATLAFVHAFVWKSVDDFADHEAVLGNGDCEERYGSGFGWCEIPRDASSFDTRIADDGFTAEAQVNLTDLFDQVGCTAKFNAVNLRGESSAENWTNSLQDYLPLPGASVDSTCATLIINKYRLGTTTKLADAHFDVYAGTTATGTPVLTDVYDHKTDVDTDAVTGQITITGIDPGTYTIKETSGPSGYFPPSGTACPVDNPATPATNEANPVSLCSIRTQDLTKSGTTTYDFYDAKQWSPLTATKNATATYDVTYAWQVEKNIRVHGDTTWNPGTATANVPTPVSGSPTADFDYQIIASQTSATKSGFEVHGTVYVSNPNHEAVTVSLSDSLADATSCSFVNAAPSVPADAVNQPYDYTCTYAGAPANTTGGTNTATVQWSKSTYPQSAGDVGAIGTYSAQTPDPDGAGPLTPGPVSATYTFAPDVQTNATISVVDDHHVWGAGSDGYASAPWTLTASPNAPFTTGTRSYTRTVTGTAGQCSTEDNTATLKAGSTGTGTTVGTPDSATARICSASGLGISKTADGDFTRTYDWSIEKFINTDQEVQQVDIPSYTHIFDYIVKVTPGGFVDSDWVVSGDITVTNTNAVGGGIAPIDVGTVTDDPSGTGEDCTVDAPPATLASGASFTVHYSCDLTGQSLTNKATVTWGTSGSASTLDVPVTWHAPSTVNESMDVYDNKVDLSTADKLGTVTWNDAGTPSSFPYSKSFTVDSSYAGSCAPDLVNMAWIGGTAQTPTERADWQDSATARICPQAGTWTVSKVNTPGDGQVAVGSDITYTLTAHKTGGVDPTNVVVTDNLSALAPYVDFPSFSAPAGQSVDFSGNVLTWTIEDLGETDATLSFTVHVRSTSFSADLPNHVFSEGATNCFDAVSAAAHDECSTDNTTPAPPVVLPPLPPQVSPPAVLPNTGGPDSWLLGAGLILLLGGGTLIAADRRRRHRS
jgi:LPXTG-motif cell wall-anchored protein/uncharacterized repeat protein (TIGR01451 family)